MVRHPAQNREPEFLVDLVRRVQPAIQRVARECRQEPKDESEDAADDCAPRSRCARRVLGNRRRLGDLHRFGNRLGLVNP